MYLIVGLGNPGEEYKHTRHNAGFLIIDRLLNVLDIKLKRRKYYLWTEGAIKGKPVIIGKPRQFVNLSGEAVERMMNDFCIGTEKILLIHDDIDLPLGNVKFQKNRGSAGHKGVESVIERLKTTHFQRIRIGIGRNFPVEGEKKDVRDYVLTGFEPLEAEIFEKITKGCIDGIFTFVEKGIDEAMYLFNRKKVLTSK